MKVTCRIEGVNKIWRNEKGQIHRKKGPAIEYANGDKAWYKNGKLHRIKDPAIEFSDGHKYWYQNGIKHRLDGPAVELSDGYKEWWFEGKRVECDSQESFESIVEAQKYMQYILQQVYGDKFSLQLQIN
jgi:hypothetical protein